MQERLIETVRDKFGRADQWVLVVGDLMLDRYLIGDVERISPEAPVPVILVKQQKERAGGAANVAANLAQLGIPTRIAGCIGNDGEGHALLRIIDDMHIGRAGVLQSEHRPTTTKTRMMGGHQQMLRLDQESHVPFNEAESQQLEALVMQQLAEQPALVIFSDYAKGVLNGALCSAFIRQAREQNIPVLVDPKGHDYSKYRGATALTPNKRETAEACRVDVSNNTALMQAAAILRKSLGLEFFAVTRGEEGISVIDANSMLHIPATAKQVFDVSGAGDTVIATLAAGLIHGLSPHEAFQLANIAAGVVVGKVGTVPITREDLLHELIAQD
ncbi:MAG TPA: D-glycero-beta-D-manno-heptose-7-phosphate kinase, partial [Methylophilaceae bacterium]|nr:D-glycero-beta-D-manno-heptose-7-phosphate kinase [Methylophilaceae bacterium]